MGNKMVYFTDDFLQFFIDLSRNNTKEWMDENRKRYEQSVKVPFENFTQALIEELQKINPRIRMQAKEAIFRMNRDIRFSHDKTPYKLHRGAYICDTHRKDFQNPQGIYVEISPEHVVIACGLYMPDKETIKDVRIGIANDLKGFEKLIAKKDFKHFFGELKGEKNKVIDKELKAAAAMQPLIYNKQFWAEAEYETPEMILEKDFVEFIVSHYKAIFPLTSFFQQAMMR